MSAEEMKSCGSFDVIEAEGLGLRRGVLMLTLALVH